ncbi:hypothetical protein BDA96_01G414400 [Sorghum bicolor]|uniref:Uncharacterized protein n=1 Tax=Sorghum bicolor TaxID=4558 RepID=A0A921V0N2_SORBI|nr:hypothetical protein BDA96_01G414400 [Sorghum bicolor]
MSAIALARKQTKSGRKHTRPDDCYGARRSQQGGFPRRRLVASGRGLRPGMLCSLLLSPSDFGTKTRTTPPRFIVPEGRPSQAQVFVFAFLFLFFYLKEKRA